MERKMLNYNEAEEVLQGLNHGTKEDYQKWWDENKPANLPRDPDEFYKKDIEIRQKEEIQKILEEQKQEDQDALDEHEEMSKHFEPLDKTKHCYTYRKALVDKYLEEIKSMSTHDYEKLHERLFDEGIEGKRELCIYNVWRLLNGYGLPGDYNSLAYYEILKDKGYWSHGV
jgi:hypothetical protein